MSVCLLPYPRKNGGMFLPPCAHASQEIEFQGRFVFEGLEQLMEQLLISNARHIRFANALGIKKIMRNILALRQNIKTMSSASKDFEFRRAKHYYGLFSAGPTVCHFRQPFDNLIDKHLYQSLLESIKNEQRYSFDEYKAMLDMQCGVDQSLGEAAVAQATDRNYGMYVIELHGLELEHSSGDGLP